MKELADIRKNYSLGELSEDMLPSSPFELFETWQKQALESQNPEPTAMHLSTVKGGKPSARLVLLKGIEDQKFVFYTNYGSKKAHEIESNANVALTFFWPELEKQVRVEGIAEKLDPEISDNYYHSRPRASRIGAWVSRQSSVINGRETIEEQFRSVEKRFDGKDIPRPDYWGGYGISPVYFEFWQGRKSRLHDRIEYSKENNDHWTIQRLSP
jgi:pyridoxamine 5'-phosphate oxidase